MPPYVETPPSLTIDCKVPVIPASLNVTQLVNILSDSLSSIEACNYRMGMIRKVEAERKEHYQILTESASK